MCQVSDNPLLGRGKQAAGARRQLRITRNQPVTMEKLELARGRRRAMTTEEQALWHALRKNKLENLHFRRQQVIAGFIVDFYCPSAHLAIEVDGASHLTTKEYDVARDHTLG